MISRSSNSPRALVALLCALVAPAYATGCAAAPLVQLAVFDRTDGRTLDTYWHRGSSYVVGEPGHEYSLRISNVSPGRVLAVISVDGVNVVTGETAAPEQSGYVIDAGETLDLQGWRKDLERTSAFYFTTIADSYAARTGRPADVGVIGVAAFREAAPIASLADATAARERSADASAPSERRESAPESEKLGTGHGRREHSPARRVAFERRNERPDQIVAIRYDSRAQLVARGVLPQPWLPVHSPQPFPGALAGFVPDP
jgi:hypothetical protein